MWREVGVIVRVWQSVRQLWEEKGGYVPVLVGVDEGRRRWCRM